MRSRYMVHTVRYFEAFKNGATVKAASGSGGHSELGASYESERTKRRSF